MEKPRVDKKEVQGTLQERVREKVEQMGIPILNTENIDEILGEGTYFSHTLVNRPEAIIDILETGELRIPDSTSDRAMTFEIDKLIGGEENVFLSLGKGYMRPDKFSLVFRTETLTEIEGATFVEDDLMNLAKEVAVSFIEDNLAEITEIVDQKREKLKERFESAVIRAFQGQYGIYEKYFGEGAVDVVEDFLDTIRKKGFRVMADEKEVIDQFTILSDLILSEDILLPELRERLRLLIKENVVKPNTVKGKEDITEAISRAWQQSDEIKSFLEGENHVPDKVSELRIPYRLRIEDRIIGVFIPD